MGVGSHFEKSIQGVLGLLQGLHLVGDAQKILPGMHLFPMLELL